MAMLFFFHLYMIFPAEPSFIGDLISQDFPATEEYHQGALRTAQVFFVNPPAFG
jgi:hypothetical protein